MNDYVGDNAVVHGFQVLCLLSSVHEILSADMFPANLEGASDWL